MTTIRSADQPNPSARCLSAYCRRGGLAIVLDLRGRRLTDVNDCEAANVQSRDFGDLTHRESCPPPLPPARRPPLR